MRVDELRALRYCVLVADAVLDQHRPDEPVRRSLPALIELLDDEISRGRREVPGDPGELVPDLIGTAEAAVILGCSQRRIQQIAADLDGRKIDGRHKFRRDAVIAYKEAKAK